MGSYSSELHFAQQLNTNSAHPSTLSYNVSLYHCRFSVFGLGSSSYPNFCAFAKKTDDMMVELGCQKMLPVALGDAMKNQENAFRWVEISVVE